MRGNDICEMCLAEGGKRAQASDNIWQINSHFMSRGGLRRYQIMGPRTESSSSSAAASSPSRVESLMLIQRAGERAGAGAWSGDVFMKMKAGLACDRVVVGRGAF